MKKFIKNILFIGPFFCLLCSLQTQALGSSIKLKVSLGKLIFEDAQLSDPIGQSCSSCHNSQQGHANQDSIVSAGANAHLFGNRNSPSITYAKYTVPWHFNTEDETWMGGFFLDGRAATMLDQAKGPFLNPLEMGNHSSEQVVAKVRLASYVTLFEQLYSTNIWKNKALAFDAIADALVAYQHDDSFAERFTSKYDAYLQDKVNLSEQESRGLTLFEAEDKGNCAACHPNQLNDDGSSPLFTDFSYDNLGVPKQILLPFYQMPIKYNGHGEVYVDIGLADNPNVNSAIAQRGKFKVPTLRNVAKTAPYMHNGVFKTLREAVEFYNTRDVDEKWRKPEVIENMNKDELGDLKLSTQEINDLLSFLKTLDDGYL
jgi:cytochrome c peroxidase